MINLKYKIDEADLGKDAVVKVETVISTQYPKTTVTSSTINNTSTPIDTNLQSELEAAGAETETVTESTSSDIQAQLEEQAVRDLTDALGDPPSSGSGVLVTVDTDDDDEYDSGVEDEDDDDDIMDTDDDEVQVDTCDEPSEDSESDDLDSDVVDTYIYKAPASSDDSSKGLDITSMLENEAKFNQ